MHRFNQVFDQSTKQEEIFGNVARGVIDKYIKFIFIITCYILDMNIYIMIILFSLSCLEGYNGTIFAYGQVKLHYFSLLLSTDVAEP